MALDGYLGGATVDEVPQLMKVYISSTAAVDAYLGGATVDL